MNPVLLARLNAATSVHVALSGDTVTWNSTVYPSVNSPSAVSQTLEEGGFREVLQMESVVRLADMATPPLVGALVTAEGRTWRVTKIDRDPLTHTLTLESPRK